MKINLKLNRMLYKHKNEIKILVKRKDRTVISINDKIIIKKANKKILFQESIFLNEYKENSLIENIIKYDKEELYSVYEYVRGNAKYKLEDIEKMLNQIINLTKTYKKICINGYGEVINTDKTWYDFLKKEVEQKKRYINLDSEKIKKVRDSLEIIKKYKIDKKMIHGDLGIYNVIYNNGTIIKIIDPRTIIGDPIYDILFFVFSSSKVVNSININNLIERIEEPIDKIKAMMYIVLYNRISIQTKHNKSTEEYEKIWKTIDLIE